MNKPPTKDRSIRRRRRLLGLTQFELSKQANISLNRIVYAETSRICLEPDELDRVKRVFKRRAEKAMDAVSA